MANPERAKLLKFLNAQIARTKRHPSPASRNEWLYWQKRKETVLNLARIERQLDRALRRGL